MEIVRLRRFQRAPDIAPMQLTEHDRDITWRVEINMQKSQRPKLQENERWLVGNSNLRLAMA